MRLIKYKLTRVKFSLALMLPRKKLVLIVSLLIVPIFLVLAPIVSTGYPSANYYPSSCVYGCPDFYAYGSLTYYLFGVGGVTVLGLGYFLSS